MITDVIRAHTIHVEVPNIRILMQIIYSMLVKRCAKATLIAFSIVFL
jgi:hypothetical protein